MHEFFIAVDDTLCNIRDALQNRDIRQWSFLRPISGMRMHLSLIAAIEILQKGKTQ